MEDSEIEKYILDQTNIEVEHNRAWPTKVMAFYVAINFGLIGSLMALTKSEYSNPLSCYTKSVVTLLIMGLGFLVWKTLKKNHINYLKYRNIQIRFQTKFIGKENEKFNLPDEWFNELEVSDRTRCVGWEFYAWIVFLVTIFVVVGIWALV